MPNTIFQTLENTHEKFMESKGKSLAINITGGTKIMAILAAEWASLHNIPAFYVDTTQESILSLQKGHSVFALKNVLNVETILAVLGYTIDKQNSAPVTKHDQIFLKQLLISAIKGGIPVLNGCTKYALDRDLLSAPLNNPPRGDLLNLLTLCKDQGILDFTSQELIFKSEDDAKLCNGFWIEDYVRSELFKLHAHKHIRSWACGVEVHSDTVKNEFDAIFSARNRLFVLECKTSQMVKKQGQANASAGKAGDDYIFKLETLGDKIGGIMVHKMLISLNNLSQAQKSRAKKYDIQLVVGNDILQLSEKIKHWVLTC